MLFCPNAKSVIWNSTLVCWALCDLVHLLSFPLPRSFCLLSFSCIHASDMQLCAFTSLLFSVLRTATGYNTCDSYIYIKVSISNSFTIQLIVIHDYRTIYSNGTSASICYEANAFCLTVYYGRNRLKWSEILD